MLVPLNFEKPTGTRDVLPEKLLLIRQISAEIIELLAKWGYEEIETPLVEYHQTVGLFSKIQDDRLIKFLDPLGKNVILRPDFTTPIARLAASIYKDIDFPIRLMYQGKVYRNSGSKGIAEVNQIGMELIGLASLEGDAEVITLAIQTILKCTNKNFKVAVGHTKFLKLLLKEIGCDPSWQDQLFQYLLDNDYVGYKNLVNTLEIDESYKEYLVKILKIRGSFATVIEAENWFDSPEWRDIFQELSKLWSILTQYQVTDYVSLDLSLVGRQYYYTGMIYHVYCEGHPYPICSGGRYDNLLENFGRDGTATGFAVNVHDLLGVVIKENGQNYPEGKTLLVYSPDQRQEAIRQADLLRAQGRVVVMAQEGTVTEKFQSDFDQIIDLDN